MERLHPAADAEEEVKILPFTFADKTVGLDVRRWIAEFLPHPDKYVGKADLALTMDGHELATPFLQA